MGPSRKPGGQARLLDANLFLITRVGHSAGEQARVGNSIRFPAYLGKFREEGQIPGDSGDRARDNSKTAQGGMGTGPVEAGRLARRQRGRGDF